MELQVNQVIEELSKIDDATENLILSADEEKREYAATIESRKKEFEEALITKMNLSIDAYKTRVKAENEKVLKQYRQETESLLNKQEASYEKNHTQWAKNIFQSLIQE